MDEETRQLQIRCLHLEEVLVQRRVRIKELWWQLEDTKYRVEELGLSLQYANRRVNELEAERDRYRAALEEAYDYIHGSFQMKDFEGGIPTILLHLASVLRGEGG